MSQTSPPSYIDYETLLSPDFSPHSFANTLVLNTNNPADTTIDLSTPLSRTLFDVQEIDTHIHNLSTQAAVPILEHVRREDQSSRRIVRRVDEDVDRLRATYQRLEREILVRYQEAEKARVGSLRSLEVLRLGRLVGRAMGWGRQLEIQVQEAGLAAAGTGKDKSAKEDHRAMVRAVYTILELKGLLGREEQGAELRRITIVKTLEHDLFAPLEEKIRNRGQQIIREFSVSNLASTSSVKPDSHYPSNSTSTTFSQTQDAKSRTTSAMMILYLLSPPPHTPLKKPSTFSPSLLLSSLQTFLQTALTSSVASICRALTTLPTLERTLLEVSARCQNVTALEMLLAEVQPPTHPLLLTPSPPPRSSPPSSSPSPERDASSDSTTNNEQDNLLSPLLDSLDTTSLPSYFWRSLASALSTRVQEIVDRGGVSARTLRSNKERVGAAIRDCVLRGGQSPLTTGGVGGGDRRGRAAPGKVSWEREAAVMAGSVVGVLR